MNCPASGIIWDLAANGKRYRSAGLEYNVDPEMYDLYTMEEATMTIEAAPTAVESDFARRYPMAIEKLT